MGPTQERASSIECCRQRVRSARARRQGRMGIGRLIHNELATLLTQQRSHESLFEQEINGRLPVAPFGEAAQGYFQKWRLTQGRSSLHLLAVGFTGTRHYPPGPPRPVRP